MLRLLADGLSNKEIAARLYLSPGTVERHLATIYRKLGLGGRVEAARYAVEHGLAQRGLCKTDPGASSRTGLASRASRPASGGAWLGAAQGIWMATML